MVPKSDLSASFAELPGSFNPLAWTPDSHADVRRACHAIRWVRDVGLVMQSVECVTSPKNACVGSNLPFPTFWETNLKATNVLYKVCFRYRKVIQEFLLQGQSQQKYAKVASSVLHFSVVWSEDLWLAYYTLSFIIIELQWNKQFWHNVLRL